MVRGKRQAKSKKRKKAAAIIATCLVILAALVVFLYRDKLSSDALGQLLGDSQNTEAKAYTYENGSNQHYAAMGGSLAIASSTGLQLLDEKGLTLSRQVFTMINPAVCTSETSCGFYDIGGSALRIYSGGEFTQLDSPHPIISLSANEKDFYALTAEESGYKGAVTVYNGSAEAVYKWYSGSGYTLDADVSPDCSSLAVLCVEDSGSIVRLFKLDSEDEFASFSLPGELAFKLSYTKSGNIAVLTENALHTYTGKGEPLSKFDFSDVFLVNYLLSDEFFTLVTGKYVSGSQVSITTLSQEGKVLGTLDLDYEPTALSAREQKLLILGSDGASIYSKKLEPLKTAQVTAGHKSALLLPKDDVLLLAAYHAEKLHIN